MKTTTALLVLSALGSLAGAQPAEPARITVDQPMPFDDFVQVLRDRGGLDLVIDRDVPDLYSEDELALDFDIDDLTVEQALSLFCEFKGLTWTRRRGVVIVADAGSRWETSSSARHRLGLLARRLTVDPFPDGLPGPTPLDALLGPLGQHELLDLEGNRLVVEGDELAVAGDAAWQAVVGGLLDEMRRASADSYPIALVEGSGRETDAELEELAAARTLYLPAGRTTRLGAGRAVQVLPTSDPGFARLRLAVEDPGLSGWTGEILVGLGEWVTILERREGDERRVLRVRVERPETTLPVAGLPTAEEILRDDLRARKIALLSFDNTPLADIVEWFRDEQGVPLYVHPEVLDEMSEEELRVSLRVSDLSIQDSLDLILSILRLGHSLRHGVLIVERFERTADRRVDRLIDRRPAMPFLDIGPDGRPRPVADAVDEDRLPFIVDAEIELAAVPGWIAFAGPADIGERLATSCARTPPELPATLRWSVRRGPVETSGLCPAGHGVALGGRERPTILRVTPADDGFLVVELSEADIAAVLDLRDGEWTALGDDLALRVASID